MQLVLPSLFDRLTEQTPVDEWNVIEMLEKKVKRDLETLLNNRTIPDFHDQERYKEVENSVINAGICDYASLVRNSPNIHKVAERIRMGIEMYEPRIVKNTLIVRARNDVEHIDQDSFEYSQYQPENQPFTFKGSFEFIISGDICINDLPIDFHTRINIADGKVTIH